MVGAAGAVRPPSAGTAVATGSVNDTVRPGRGGTGPATSSGGRCTAGRRSRTAGAGNAAASADPVDVRRGPAGAERSGRVRRPFHVEQAAGGTTPGEPAWAPTGSWDGATRIRRAVGYRDGRAHALGSVVGAAEKGDAVTASGTRGRLTWGNAAASRPRGCHWCSTWNDPAAESVGSGFHVEHRDLPMRPWVRDSAPRRPPEVLLGLPRKPAIASEPCGSVR